MRSTKYAAILLFVIALAFGIRPLAGQADELSNKRPLTPTSSIQKSTSADERLKDWKAAREKAKKPIDSSDLNSLERKIKVEPDYEGDERHYYCLIFDDDQTQMMWMVFDGSTLYADCNFNGDLTDKGEAFAPDNDKRTSLRTVEQFSFTTERGQDVSLEYTFPGFTMPGSDPSEYPVRIKVKYRGATFSAWGDQTGEVANAKSPSVAPILRVNGPLQMGFEVSSRSAVRRTKDDGFEVKAGVGTYGLGEGSFMHLKYWHDAIPDDVFPQAELVFPAKDNSNPSVTAKLKLTERC